MIVSRKKILTKEELLERNLQVEDEENKCLV